MRTGSTWYSVNDLLQIYSDETRLSEEAYDFETVHNIDEYGAEFVPTMREALKTWNMTVQYWLATIVYRHVIQYKFLTLCTCEEIFSPFLGAFPSAPSAPWP